MQREIESLVMERKGSLVKGKKGKKISKQGHHLWGRGGVVQTPETSTEEEEGFNLTQKPTGGE